MFKGPVAWRQLRRCAEADAWFVELLMLVKTLRSLLPRAAFIAHTSGRFAVNYPLRPTFPQSCCSFSSVVMDVPTFDLQVRRSSCCYSCGVL